METKDSGFEFERNRVLASPSYWDYFFRDVSDPIIGRIFNEDSTGVAVQNLLFSDTGYIICNSCKTMLEGDPGRAKEYRLEYWFDTVYSRGFKATNRVQVKEQLQATLITIATIYEGKSGKWPSFVAQDEFDARARRWASPNGGSATARADAPATPKPNSPTQTSLQVAAESYERYIKKWWQFWK